MQHRTVARSYALRFNSWFNFECQNAPYKKKKQLPKLDNYLISLVIRLGLEPKTPSLKGMCSTC